MSSAYHHQTDGQTEIMNKGLEGYLRSSTRDWPKDWPKDWMRWLSLAEWAYNTSEHTSTRLTLFEVVYGYQPPRLLPSETGITNV